MLNILQKRKSVRKYIDEKISEENLQKILQAALLSPSGKSLKSWEFIVIKNKETIDKLSKIKASSNFVKDANIVIAVLGNNEKSDTWIEDTSVAIYNMHLMASSLGLGSCWIQCRGRTTKDGQDCEAYAREFLKFPESHKLLAILPIGSPDQVLKEHSLEQLDWQKVHKEVF